MRTIGKIAGFDGRTWYDHLDVGSDWVEGELIPPGSVGICKSNRGTLLTQLQLETLIAFLSLQLARMTQKSIEMAVQDRTRALERLRIIEAELDESGKFHCPRECCRS